MLNISHSFRIKPRTIGSVQTNYSTMLFETNIWHWILFLLVTSCDEPELHMQILDTIEESFKSGKLRLKFELQAPIPIIYGNLIFQLKVLVRRSLSKNFATKLTKTNIGKNSLRMVKLFRKVINDRDNLPCHDQRRLVASILNILAYYERLSDCRETSCWKRAMTIYQRTTLAFGFVPSPELYERFLENDLRGVEKKLKTMGAQECDIELARIVTRYLILKGQLPEEDWAWLASMFDKEDCEKERTLRLPEGVSSEGNWQLVRSDEADLPPYSARKWLLRTSQQSSSSSIVCGE